MPRWGKDSNGWLYPTSHLLKADVHPLFEDLIPNYNDYEETFHGFEYRLGLIQANEEGPGSNYPLEGEYVTRQRWSWGDDEAPFAETAFRAAATRSRDWPWPAYLEDDALDASLLAHREILKRYRRWA